MWTMYDIHLSPPNLQCWGRANTPAEDPLSSSWAAAQKLLERRRGAGGTMVQRALSAQGSRQTNISSTQSRTSQRWRQTKPEGFNQAGSLGLWLEAKSQHGEKVEISAAHSKDITQARLGLDIRLFQACGLNGIPPWRPVEGGPWVQKKRPNILS